MLATDSSLFGLKILQRLGDASGAGEDCHLGTVDDLAFARRRRIDAEFA